MKIVWSGMLIACLTVSAHARSHVQKSGTETPEQIEKLTRTFSLICRTKNRDWSKKIAIYVAAHPNARFLDRNWGYADVSVDHITFHDGFQYLGGRATDVNGYQMTRQAEKNGQVEWVNYWYFDARDLDCALRNPGEISPGNPFRTK
ncbi:MAG: hypothetical protein ABJH45_26475 [Paracoccaceae bacterium]